MLTSGANLGISSPLEIATRQQNERLLAEKQASLGRYGHNPARVNGYSENTYPTAARGVICEKGCEDKPSRILIFQFNPETITDVKSNNYNTKAYSGFTFNDNVWASGGERIISFKLQFIASAAFNTPFFGKEVSYGNDQVSTLDKMFPRGTLDYVELLQSFQYPTQQDPDAPRFANGGFVPSPRFMPPPVVVFAYGNYYLEGVIGDVNVTHLTTNNRNIPIQSDVDITFKVSEQQQIKVKNITGSFSSSGSQVLGSPNANTSNGDLA